MQRDLPRFPRPRELTYCATSHETICIPVKQKKDFRAQLELLAPDVQDCSVPNQRTPVLCYISHKRPLKSVCLCVCL